MKIKKKYCDKLAERLKEIETKKPALKVGMESIPTIESSIRAWLDQTFEKPLVIQDYIPNSAFDLPFSESAILREEDAILLKEWVPKKYGFSPTLLYQATRDGMTPQAFHSKCDNKGPTITIVKCQYDEASQSSIIGGFADQDWHSRGEYTNSNEAFIFSLSSKVKCTVAEPQYAILGTSDRGPSFGAGQDMAVLFRSSSQVTPRSYLGTASLVDAGKNKGGASAFTPQEIEVYALK